MLKKITYYRTKNTNKGSLVFSYDDGDELHVNAFSGLPGVREEWVRGQSPIPEGTHVLYTDIKNPKAEKPDSVGEIGPSYSIGSAQDRNTINGPGGRVRKFIELHFDQNMGQPGHKASLGCVVRDSNSQLFEKGFYDVSKANSKRKTIPFEVIIL
jgi:hypothetical protein